MSYIIIFITAIAMFMGHYKFGFDGLALFCVAFTGVFLAFIFDDAFWER